MYQYHFVRGNSLLLACEGNLRNLGVVVEKYSVDHNGHFPQNLRVLEEQMYLSSYYPVCPVKNHEYIYQVDGWDDNDFTIWCPNPKKHIGDKPFSLIGKLFGRKIRKKKHLYFHYKEGLIHVWEKE